MTKKLATLVAMLACCVFGALAQRVATTPVTDVQTGDYLLLVHSGKTAADGSWAYINTSNNRVNTDDASLGTTAYAGSKIENNAYIWHVEKRSDGKITIQSVAQKTYWPTAKGRKDSDYYPQHITTSSSANAFELIALSDGFALKSTTSITDWFGQVTSTPAIYVVNNNNSQIGYHGGYDDSKIENQSEIARVEFYPLQAFTELTYNYVFDGKVRASVKVNAVDGEEYPTPTTAISLPDFIAAPTLKPEGIYHDGAATSYDLQLASTLPFTLSTDANRVYYYLAAGAGTEGRTMLYANGKDLELRAEAQADNLTAMRNDLWYVTGNPYDGLKFHNVGSGTTAMSKLALSDKTELGLSPALGGGHETWKIYKISDKAFGLYSYNNWFGNVAWKLNGSKVSFEKIDANVPNTSDAFAFQTIEATYVLPLHNSEADNAAFATTCAPFNFAIVGDDVKAYAGKLSADGKELDMKEIEGNVPANQGVILKAAMGVSEVTVKVVNTADAIDNDLKGTNDEMTDLSQVYVFGRDKVTRHVGFYTAAGDAPLPANRAYLDKPAQEAVNAVAMNFGNGMVTNINTAISAQSADNAPIYDLSGRRVQRTVKGSLYIKGGRKFMAQ